MQDNRRATSGRWPGSIQQPTPANGENLFPPIRHLFASIRHPFRPVPPIRVDPTIVPAHPNAKAASAVHTGPQGSTIPATVQGVGKLIRARGRVNYPKAPAPWLPRYVFSWTLFTEVRLHDHYSEHIGVEPV